VTRSIQRVIASEAKQSRSRAWGACRPTPSLPFLANVQDSRLVCFAPLAMTQKKKRPENGRFFVS
jgi:hypothetical protein